VAKLGRGEIVTIQVLDQQGQNHCQTARVLEVTEGAVRYHLRRAAAGAVDGRGKVFMIEKLGLEAVVREWWEAQQAHGAGARPPNVEGLYDFLREEHHYRGSYKSVRRYARAHFPAPLLRPFRRIETPPGAQSQSDWGEFSIDIGDENGLTKLHAFVMVLSHSRKVVVVWSRSAEQLSWHRCHNEAYRRLGGVAAVNRIDNLKTGVTRGAGAWGELNAQYKTYARTLGFHIDACEPFSPEQKGKTERQVGVLRSLDVTGRCFDSLAHLQEWTDAKLEALSQRRMCPATGLSVAESWAAERAHLKALPENLPEPFDVVKTCPVHKDCSIRFEGRTYIVPFRYVGQCVEARGCAGFVQIVDRGSGEVVVQYPRGTQERLLIEPRCYEGDATERVAAPKPLGKMARKLQELAAMPVQQRPMDLYAALAEVAR
jgi:transposase